MTDKEKNDEVLRAVISRQMGALVFWNARCGKGLRAKYDSPQDGGTLAITGPSLSACYHEAAHHVYNFSPVRRSRMHSAVLEEAFCELCRAVFSDPSEDEWTRSFLLWARMGYESKKMAKAGLSLPQRKAVLLFRAGIDSPTRLREWFHEICRTAASDKHKPNVKEN